LGLQDAILEFLVEGYAPQDKTRIKEPPSVTQYMKHYFRGDSERTSGFHTLRIREAFNLIQRKQKSKYFLVIIVIALVAIGIGIFSYFQQQELKRQKQLAEEIFYSMKSLELEIVRIENRLLADNREGSSEQLQEFAARENELLQNYEKFLEEIHFYESGEWSETDRIVLRVARLFGECELTMPRGFLDLVYEYIEEWKKSPRLRRAIQRANEKGFNRTAVEIMLDHGLPPHFFFVAMQESDFREKVVGPSTRFGIAKGIWQFIPATAVRYGLKTGPLVEVPRYDPKDERFDYVKATEAAARYIRDIYNTEAQASGLLVIASYNWGERNVRRLVRELPLNPRERNFWKLLERYGKEIPKETYNYVFYIISAAVIAEDPQMFGFSFSKPLEIPELEMLPAGMSTPGINISGSID
jgi:hypothetical protein